jgi:S-(hydroxymethyl)glutathione dehydrogenase/alcohol dehydrogenase
MKAAVLREPNRPLEIEEVQVSKPGPREVLVRTLAAGVCHSDLHFMDGSYPYALPTILGHESAGIVEQPIRAARSMGISSRTLTRACS